MTFVKYSLAAMLPLAATLGMVQAPALAQDAPRAELNPMARVTALRQIRAANGEDEGDRVFGGLEADTGEYPFQVALLAAGSLDDSADSQFYAQFCGGSLIAPEWVLTAAHCLVDGGKPIPTEVVKILTGATALNEGTRHDVAEVIVHPGYSETNLDNDIGLIRLATPADSPVIEMTGANVEQGDATVIGWGMMETGDFPANLMEVDIELVPNAACNAGIKEIYQRDLNMMLQQFSYRMRYSQESVQQATEAISASMGDPLTENMMCAGIAEGGRDSCSGDSGGPLFTVEGGKAVQVGVVSWGEGPMDAGAACGHANAYGVYTRLANYQDWIATEMAE